MAKSTSARATSSLHKEFVGENLTRARESLKMKQSELARAMGIAQNKLNQWESGLYYPDPWFLRQMCEDYGFTTDWFYRRVMAGVSAARAVDLKRAVGAAEAGRKAPADQGV